MSQMTIDKAIDKLQKLSRLTSSREPCEMAIASLKVTRALGLSFLVRWVGQRGWA